MLDAYIYDGIRTPIGRHAGKLAGVRPDDLAGEAIAEVVKRNHVKPEEISDVILGCVTQAVLSEQDLFRFDANLPWLLAGFVGSVLWSGRFVVQWYASERLGKSVLPASFFWMSLVGSVLLCAYAVFRPQPDWVNIFAFALNPIPYGRNLILIYRHRRAGRGDDGHPLPVPPEQPGGEPAGRSASE